MPIYMRSNVEYPLVNFLLIGGGGGGSQYYGGGGGAGGVIQCCNYMLCSGTYSVVIGQGGCGYATRCDGCDGCNSSFASFIAYGGGGGGGYSSRPGHNGGSGGGDGYHNGTGGGTGIEGQGHNGGNHCVGNSSGGGGGAGSAGFNGTYCQCGGYGGCGIQSDIDGELKWYASGGDGHNGYNCCFLVAQPWCPALNGTRDESNATTYGGGGGGIGGANANYGKGKQGIFIISYPQDFNNITGGNCVYCCNGNKIHIFTSNGNLLVT